MIENQIKPVPTPVLVYICMALVVLELAMITVFGLGFPGQGIEAIILLGVLFTYGVGFGLVLYVTGVTLYKKASNGWHKAVAIATILLGLNALLVYPVLYEIRFVASVFNATHGFITATNEYAWLNLNKEERDLHKQYKDLQNEFSEPSYVYFGTHNGFQLVGKYIADTIAVTPFYDLSPTQDLRFLSSGDEQAWLRLQNNLVGKPVVIKLPDFDAYYKIVRARSTNEPILEPVPAQIYWQGKNVLDGIHFAD